MSALRRLEKGESIAGFALVALLLFASMFMLISVGRLFFVEGLVKSSLNETLRAAEGNINLWVTDPEGQDKQAFYDAVASLDGQFAAAGPADPEKLNLLKVKHKVGGKELELRLAFLPPGYCGVDEEGNTTCNSHVCNPNNVPGNCSATICLNGQTQENIPCSQWEQKKKQGATWGSCEKDQYGAPLKSLCAKVDDGKKSYHDLLRNYPVELKASFNTSTMMGNLRRQVVVAGYPRILIKEQVAQVPHPPICTGNWMEVRSCVPPTECGVLSAQGTITWVCSNQDCWCKQRPADGTYLCYNPNPYPGVWSCPFGSCVAQAPSSCDGTISCSPVCSSPNCCDLANRPSPETRKCSVPNCVPQPKYTCSITDDKCEPIDTQVSAGKIARCFKDGNEVSNAECNNNGVPCNSIAKNCGGDQDCTSCTKVDPVCGAAPASATCVNGKKTWIATGYWDCPVIASPGNYCPHGPDPTKPCEEPCSPPPACLYKFQKLPHPNDDYAVRTSGTMPACLSNIINGSCNLQTFLNKCNDPDHEGGFYCGKPGAPQHCGFCKLQEAASFATCVFDALGFTGPGGDVKTVYVDNQCKTYNTLPAGSSECGGYEIETMSPVSLLWNGQSDLKGEPALVKFAVNPEQQGSWFTWWGSSDAPLVVYDPNRSGKINGAAQLFGNHTFGGKMGQGGKMELWSNGFEALGSLDLNKDNELRGDELKDLALWFDQNRDGVSQSGEVRSLKAEGVTALFVTEPKLEDGSYRLVKGYERRGNGKLSIGVAIDWYSSAGSDVNVLPPSAIIMPHKQGAPLAYPSLPRTGELAEATKTDSFRASGADWVHLGLDGVWEWTADGTAPEDGLTGLLVIKDDQGKLSGTSVVQNVSGMITKQPFNRIVAAPVSGLSRKNSDGSRSVEFSVRGRKGNEDTLTTAKVLADGTTMVGRSRQVGTSVGGKDVLFDYAWTARRKVN